MSRARQLSAKVAGTGANYEERPSRLGYGVAILLSALGHGAVFFFGMVVLPGYLRSQQPLAPTYTVKIVDNLPAGDLGTHLPPLKRRARREHKAEQTAPKPEEPKPAEAEKTPPAPADNDKNAIALNTKPAATETQTPTPKPTAEPTSQPTSQPKKTPRSAPKKSERKKPQATPSAQVARAEPTSAVREKLRKLREQLLAERLKRDKEEQREPEEEQGEPEAEAEGGASESGGGPVEAEVASAGKGYGIGPGEGSAGIQQDPEFLLYYRTVQEKVKKAWTFGGDNPTLATQLLFAINPDGRLAGVKITKSSNDSAFDESVIRAVRSAAPFAPPPEKYRTQFAEGILAEFKLGELKS